MHPDVHRDPERLREHAAAARELADVLRAALSDADPSAMVPVPHRAELDRLDTSVRRAARELAELGDALAAAAAVGHTDVELAAGLGRAIELRSAIEQP